MELPEDAVKKGANNETQKSRHERPRGHGYSRHGCLVVPKQRRPMRGPTWYFLKTISATGKVWKSSTYP